VSLGTSGADVAAARALSVSQMLASLYGALGRNDANGVLCRRRPGPTPGLSMTSAANTSALRARSADPDRVLLTANPSRGSHSVEAMWQHQCRLLCVARRILRNEADAEDAVQEAYLSAVRHFRKFEGRSSILTWLTTIVVNQALTQLRVRRGQPAFETISTSDTAEAVVCISRAQNPEQQALRKEVSGKLRSALQGMPEKYRTVIQLRQLGGMSIIETAARLGVTEECIKTRLHRANHLLNRTYRGGDRPQ
jgi:RNA polymerase sigma-70 factor, ECF subfamily